MRESLAVIDIGTNSVLLLVVRRLGNRLISLHEESETPCLGMGLAQTGRISSPSITRLIRTLRHYRRICDLSGAARIITVGTQVFRAARNGKRVIKEVARHTGLRITVLPEGEEAKLAFFGAMSGLPQIHHGVLVDVGGGSTEFVLFQNRGIVRSVSLPVGAVVLCETALRRFWRISDTRLARAQAVVSEHFSRLPMEFRHAAGSIIGVGGTITTLAALDRRLKKYHSDPVHGSNLTRRKIERRLVAFRQMTVSDIRRAIPFDPARAPVLPAGTLIWVEVLKHLGGKSITVSHRGLRWGVAESFFKSNGKA